MMKRTHKMLALFIVAIISLSAFTACDFAQKIVGDAICLTCMNTQKVKCADCDGEKRTICPRCEGSELETCWLCQGTGRRTCYDCWGLGGEYEYTPYFGQWQYVYRLCYTCNASGYFRCEPYINCSSCPDGKVDCGTCEATGEVDCPRCVIVEDSSSEEMK